ncbi:MAG TPA: calcium-binding protein [Allosphingosinicella sp.]|jgi:Ca2+-binding RTX toxin-like protein|nr:calcium-binding protein [Allosphingosinicella sp.]
MARLEGTFRADTINGTAGDDRIEGKGGNDVLSGGGGNDKLDGGSGADRLAGGAGNDILEGESGDDILNGGLGRDILEGGTGNDRLTGGGGADIFEFEEPNNGRDVITDFQDGLDKIEIEFEGDETFGALAIHNDGSGNAIVSWDGGFVTVLNVSASQLTASDFIF